MWMAGAPLIAGKLSPVRWSGVSKLINQPCTISLVNDQRWGMRPARVTWRGSAFRVVRVLECWAMTNRWWEKERPSSVWRLEVTDRGRVHQHDLHSWPEVALLPCGGKPAALDAG
jgi:hypothetical protein